MYSVLHDMLIGKVENFLNLHTKLRITISFIQISPTCNFQQKNTCCVISSRYYTISLFGLMFEFGPIVFYFFGPPVFIYLVIQFQSSDPITVPPHRNLD